MKISKSKLVYNILCNIPVSFFLTLASNLYAGKGVILNWGFFMLNFGVSFILSMIIGLFVPLVEIGKWFTGLFHVKNDTYTGNIAYRLLATLAISIIFFFGVNPPLTLLNYFLLKNVTIVDTLINWAISSPLMLLVGFVSSLISDFGAYHTAHSLDPNF